MAVVSNIRLLFVILLLIYKIGRTQKIAPWLGRNVCEYHNVKEISLLRPHVLMLRENLTKQCICHPSMAFECYETRIKLISTCFPCRGWTTSKVYKCCPGWEKYQKGKGCVTKSRCKVSLPHKDNASCAKDRGKGIQKARKFFHLSTPISANSKYRKEVDVLFPMLNQSTESTIKHAMEDSFLSHWFDIYFKGMLLRNNETYKAALKLFGEREVEESKDYMDIYNFFIGAQKEATKPFFNLPAQEVNYFKKITQQGWKADQVFVEQRLAGLNPMYLKRVTLSGAIGIALDTLMAKLNPSFDWEAEIQRVVGTHHTIKTAAAHGLLYAVDYPMYHDIPHVEDIMNLDHMGERVMRKSTSPITLYAVGRHDTGKNELKVVAIQIDYRNDSPVYTPVCGSQWSLAKATAQIADFAIVEIYDHLLRTHIRMEPICVCLPRHLADKHPLHQILKYHCRGLIPVNSYGFPRLTNEMAYMHMLFAMGHIGSFKILNDGFEKMFWGDDDFLEDLARRGVDNSTLLPYFPYRDDGKIIYHVLRNFGRDVVNLYYKSDEDVISDTELQGLINELSAEGKMGPFGGRGMVRGLPPSFQTREEVAEFIFRIIWLVVQHAAVNYPISDYGAITPNMPTKLYHDSRNDKNKAMLYSLPGRNISMLQSYVAMNLGTIRYDVMFDYGKDLEDEDGKDLVDKYYRMMMSMIKPMMDATDRQRTARGHLSYPYLIPNWLPNSIHT